MTLNVNVPGREKSSDQYYSRIISLMNNLHASFSDGENLSETKAVFTGLLSLDAYVKTPNGKIAHEVLISEVKQLKRKLENGDDLVPYDLMSLLVDFLNNSGNESGKHFAKSA